MHKKRIAIIGASGYTGSELVRLLLAHPRAEIIAITSESQTGKEFSEIHPQFRNICHLSLSKAADVPALKPDLVFLALPHGVSMDMVKAFSNAPFPVVDLSGDFRLSNAADYEEWYKMTHSYPQGISDAAYGLPEFFSDEISGSRLVANPGCFPTGAILALAPLLKAGWIASDQIIVDAKTGITGAGVKASATTHFPDVYDNFKAYGLKTHRHTIEIEDILHRISGHKTRVQFQPHLLPVDRGILSTIYARPLRDISQKDLNELYTETYRDKPFVRRTSTPPSIKEVRGSNYCDLYYTLDERTGNLLLISAIDNLVKGAAGAAVQNMNLLLGLEETMGLTQIPLKP